MSVVVVATVKPAPEHRAAVVAAFEAAAGPTHAEDGCEAYALHEGADRFVVVEKWASREALETHFGSPALAAMLAAIDGLLTEPLDVQILRPHPAGKTDKGAL